MNNTMKRRMIAFVAAIAAVVSLSGCDDNYDETPPLAKDYLTKYIMPDGVMRIGRRSQAKKMNMKPFWKVRNNC